jgi:acyl-CoA thioester hydrolase
VVKQAETGKFKKVVTDLSVRFRDIDAMRHVNDAVLFTYFEEGRKVFLEEVFGIVQPEDYPFILAQISCDYLKPLKLGDSPRLEVWIGEVGQRKFSFIYRIVDGSDAERVYAHSKSVMALFDYVKKPECPARKSGDEWPWGF